jgi:uncharacterized protein YdaU (DUF1376 family)
MTSSASHRNPDSPDNAKSPAFQFYPKDFLTDENVLVMSLQERGAYITLLCVCWQQGTLPDDQERLARLCGVPVPAFRRLWPALAVCFRAALDQPGRLVQPRLEREREKQANFARRQSDRGRLGGRPKKPDESGNKATAFPPLSGAAKPEQSGAAKPGKALQSSSSSSSSDFSQKELARPQSTDVSPEASTRAGDFCRWYEDTHERLFSVGYFGTNNDYMNALRLVEKFSDQDLQDAALVWFGQDDDFATKGTRTIAKFASRVTGCLQDAKRVIGRSA